MLQQLSVRDLSVLGKKVLVRVDFNVPLNQDGTISDDTKIIASLPTIQDLLHRGAAVILMSHLGRPKGKRNPEHSLARCGVRLSELLGIPVRVASDCVGPKVKALAQNLTPGEVLLLENLRFHQAEEVPSLDHQFAKQLAALADFYVNDAFGSAHRAHSSVSEVPSYFPGRAAAGLLMEKEIEFLGHTVVNPKRPFCSIIGGAKVSTKIGVLKSLIMKADTLMIGGGMAYTFFKAKGVPVGGSLCEDDCVDEAREVMAFAKEHGVSFLLPVDHVISDSLTGTGRIKVVSSDTGIPQGWYGVDIGPQTVDLFRKNLASAKTVFWNGPAGIFEIESFATGTNEVAQMLSTLDATTIVGGGDSIAAVKAAGVADKMSFISTGGGASLEYIEFGQLPGIESLTVKNPVEKLKVG